MKSYIPFSKRKKYGENANFLSNSRNKYGGCEVPKPHAFYMFNLYIATEIFGYLLVNMLTRGSLDINYL